MMPTRYLATALFLFTGAALLLSAGCDDGEDPGDCPPGANASVGLMVISERCSGCHSSTAPGGAPAGLDLGDMQVILDNADRISGVVESGAMPPGAPLSDAEVEQVQVALACSAME